MMKKHLFWLVTALIAATGFTACNDDDDKDPVNYAVSLAEAAGSYTGTDLEIYVGGQSVQLLEGQAARIGGMDADQVTISIPDYAIPGETGLTFTGVKMTTPLFNVFEGENVNASRSIALKGELRDGRLRLDLTPAYRSDIVGVWNFNTELDENETVTLAPISIATDEGVSLGFGEFILPLVGVMLQNSMALINLEFHADGNLTATYNANTLNDMMAAMNEQPIAPVFVHTPMNAMKWYTKDGALYLVPNLNLMFKNNPTKAQLGPLDISKIMTVGIPLHYTKQGDKMTAYASKDQMEPVFEMLSAAIQLIDPAFELELGEDTSIPLRSMLEMILQPICDVATDPTVQRFDLCLNFKAGAVAEEAPQLPDASAAAVIGGLNEWAKNRAE